MSALDEHSKQEFLCGLIIPLHIKSGWDSKFFFIATIPLLQHYRGHCASSHLLFFSSVILLHSSLLSGQVTLMGQFFVNQGQLPIHSTNIC